MSPVVESSRGFFEELDHGAGGLTGSVMLVDDADGGAVAGQREGQDEAGRAGAGDDYGVTRHVGSSWHNR